MISPAKRLAAFHRPQVADVLDHTDFTGGALGAIADITDISGAHIAAIQAFARSFRDGLHDLGQGGQNRSAFLDQMQNSPARGAWSKAGQFRHHLDQMLYVTGAIGHLERQVHTRWKAQFLSHFTHLGLGSFFGFLLGVFDRGKDQIFDDFFFVWIKDLLVDI